MATITIHALYKGFPFDLQFDGRAAELDTYIDSLEAIGATPATPNTTKAAELEARQDAPRCRYHGAMKPSAKAPGTWFCSHKMGDGSYCKEKA